MTYLQSVVAALEAVVQLAGGIGPDQLANDHVRLRAVERYWVLAGNAAKAHAHAEGLAAGPNRGQDWRGFGMCWRTTAWTKSSRR